jgi:hypothetical protein
MVRPLVIKLLFLVNHALTMKIVACICLLLIPFTGTAQPAKADTSFLTTSVDYAMRLYARNLKGESPLHNGAQYGEYISLNDEHPYFLGDDWMEGSVVYQDDRFDNIPIQFDISANKVITEHATSGHKIELINEKIAAFTIGDHHFIKIEEKPGDTLQVTPGFYELLAEGPHLTLLARRIKTLQKRVKGNEAIVEFEEINRYYYLKQNVYYNVKGKKSVLQALTDKKSVLKQQLKKNKIRFGNTREKGLIEAAKLYNTLKDQE